MGLIRRGCRGAGVVAVFALLMGPVARSQTVGVAPATQPQTVLDVLHQLSDKADVIFAGQVVGVRRPDDASWVEVKFRVDEAIVGCSVGTPYVLREWAGLWAGDAQRYRVGQRLLMLLHAPSAAGMSSPVGGLDGAIPIRQGGTATPLGDGATAPELPFVDLRWLGPRLPHAVSYRSEGGPAARRADVAVPFLAQQQAVLVTAGGSIRSALPMPTVQAVSRSDGSVPAQQASVTAVIEMLTTWQKAQHGAP
jgi:hypothetical protein